MAYITPEVIIKAREMDLLTYLQQYEPGELVHFGGDTYCTREHDSLKISNGMWFWFSRGIGGRSALDYLIKVKNMSFIEAVERITGQTANTPSVFASSRNEDREKKLLLPKRCHTGDIVTAYLTSRGLDPEIIQFSMDQGILYESYPHHSAVFVGRDAAGKARYANIRGTDSDFKGEANGSDKRFSFSLPVSGSTELHVFESAIDLLSYASLLKLDGKEWQRDHLVSLAGVYHPKNKESAMPLALKQFLADHPGIRKITLRLDNDLAGRSAAAALKEVLAEKYEVSSIFPGRGKDYNDLLCLRKEHREHTERRLER